MKTIQTTVTVTEEGKLTIQVPHNIPPGKHRIVLVIDEQVADEENRPPLNFPVHDFGPWSANLSLRREDMYGEFGR